jgi:hypothetical protein
MALPSPNLRRLSRLRSALLWAAPAERPRGAGYASGYASAHTVCTASHQGNGLLQYGVYGASERITHRVTLRQLPL